MPAYGPVIIQDQATPRSALVAPGFCTPVNSAQFVALQLLWPVVKVTPAQFDDIRAAVTKPQAVDNAVAALPEQIPLTVQGASEAFITDRMLQVQNRDDTNANMLNLQIIQSKNEVLAALNS